VFYRVDAKEALRPTIVISNYHRTISAAGAIFAGLVATTYCGIKLQIMYTSFTIKSSNIREE